MATFPTYAFSPADVVEVWDGQKWGKVEWASWVTITDPETPQDEILVFGVKFQGVTELTVWTEGQMPAIRLDVL